MRAVDRRPQGTDRRWAHRSGMAAAGHMGGGAGQATVRYLARCAFHRSRRLRPERRPRNHHLGRCQRSTALGGSRSVGHPAWPGQSHAAVGGAELLRIGPQRWASLFSSTAATLVRRGISAVAAMQFTVSDPGAINFARGFYSALANGKAIDEAARSGRVGILSAPGTLEWVTPVLYVRGETTQLFDLK